MTTFTRNGHEGVKFFIGGEIEHTPAFNKKTLFVVGLQDIDTILRLTQEHNIKHVFLSANRSFDTVSKVNGVYMVENTLASDWEKQIHLLLDSGYMVSLDYPAHKHVMVLEILNKGIWQSRNFVPILSVAIPHVSTSSVNLTIKIDDSNFGATNPGVWCINHHEITDSNRFTGWNEYGDDLVLDFDGSETANPAVIETQDRRVYTIDIDNMDADQALEVVTTAMKDADTLNQTELGLDVSAVSSLKSIPESLKAMVPATPVAAAEAYAAGATSDPLSEKDLKNRNRLNLLLK